MLRDGDDPFYYIDMYSLVSLTSSLHNCHSILEMTLRRRPTSLWPEHSKLDEEILHKNVTGSLQH